MMTANAENQALDDQVETPLDRAEILRLVKASRNIGYNPSQEAFTQPREDFKPLSIKAMAALSANVAKEKAKAEAAEAAAKTAKISEEPAAEAADQAPSGDKGEAETAPPQNPDTAMEAAPEADGVAEAPRGDELSASDTPPAADAQSDDSELSGTSTPADAPDSIETIGEQVNRAAESAADTDPEAAGSFDEIKAKMDAVSRLKPGLEGGANSNEYQRGYDEGRKAALAEKDAEMNEAIAAFASATDALGKDENIDLSQLSPAISRAIMELASERAGIAIDAHPDAFAARIETMVGRIRNRVDEPYIRLHPDDAKIIGEKLEEKLSPRVIHIIADEALKRGDARIDVGSIGIMDLISSHMADVGETPAKMSEGDNEHD